MPQRATTRHKILTMKSLFAFLLLAFIGVAAAFFRPAAPFQVGEMPQGGHVGLDNENIKADENIQPVR